MARAADGSRVSLDTLATLQVPVPGGRTVALSQFANFSFDQEQPFLWRRDRLPTLTVLADVVNGDTPEAAVAALTPQIAELNASLPVGYEIQVGGTVETSAESSASVFAVVPLMVFLMITLLMVQLKNFKDMAMVVILLPLGLIGVVAALLAFGRPLGFVAILGILALIGMIAKNAVILITQISDERAAGKSVEEAAVAAATSRLRPLLLTALSTVLGMLPIAPTLFWGPMAFAIMGGLMVATLLTLVLLPTHLRHACTAGAGQRPEPAPMAEAAPDRSAGRGSATSEATTGCSRAMSSRSSPPGIATVALALLAFDLAGDDFGAVIGTALSLKMLAYVFAAPGR